MERLPGRPDDAAASDSTPARRASDPDGRAAMFEAAFHRSIVPTTISTIAGDKLIEINQAACELLGMIRAEVLGKTSKEADFLIDDEDRARLGRLLQEHGAVSDYVAPVKVRGKDRWQSVTASLVQVQGEPCIIASFVDITDKRLAEEELRASEARFSAAFNQAGVMMLITNLREHGVVVDVNDAFVRQSGLSREQVIGRRADTLGLFVNPADEGVIVSQLMAFGRVRNLQLAVKTASGNDTAGLFSADLIRLNGDPHAIFTIVDLTDRVLAEERLRAEEVRYRNLVEQMVDGVAQVDEAGLLLDVNPAMCELMGRSREELIGTPWSSYVEPTDLARLPFLAPESELGKPAAFVRRVVRPDGSVRELEIHARRYPNGQLIGLVRDIGERKAADQERARLIQAIEQSADQTLIIEPSGRILYINPAWERQTRWRRTDIGLHFRDLISSARAEAYYQALIDRAAREGSCTIEMQGRDPEGRATYDWLTVSAVKDAAGDVSSYVIVRRDVTHERELEELLRQSQKMEAVGRLAGGVAHDFNNLLTAISGFSELGLMQAPPGSDLYEYLQQIKSSAQRASNVTRQLLTFGRRAATKPEILDLNQICTDIFPMLKRLIGEDVDLKLRLTSGLRHVLADRGQIDQVIVNLVVNARDAVGPGGRIEISTSNVGVETSRRRFDGASAHRRDVRLKVTDDGVGIEPEHIELIWEPFFTTKPSGGGGLGLATVFGIVRTAGGHIHVDSAPGRGASFMIDLPAVEGEPAVEEAASEPAGGRGRETILVVEDEPAVLGFASQLLERNGYRVLRASNGKEALNVSRTHPGEIDLVFSDIVMPGMNGREAARTIQADRPDTRILLASGYSEETNQSGGRLDVPFLPKPYSTDELLRAIRDALADDGAAATAEE